VSESAQRTRRSRRALKEPNVALYVGALFHVRWQRRNEAIVTCVRGAR
jgi:hypothetical protein